MSIGGLVKNPAFVIIMQLMQIVNLSVLSTDKYCVNVKLK